MPPKSGKPSAVAGMMDEAIARAPEKYKPYVQKVKPFVVAAADAADKAWPYAVQGWNTCMVLWEKAQPYNPQQFFPVLVGLMMCFFGGSYFTLIAAVEAVRLSVWGRLQHSFTVLVDNYKRAKEESKKDDKVDADGDGVADVQQIDSQQLFTRKLFVIMRSIDPQETTEALAAVWAGFLSVLATVRIKFAQSVTLGCAIGDLARQAFATQLQALLKASLPEELQKWAPSFTQYAFNLLGCLIAFFLQTFVGAFHSAVRGGKMAAVNGILLAKKFGWLSQEYDQDSKQTGMIAMGIAAVGFLWQLSNGFAVPFPLNILLLPFSIVEMLLKFFLTLGL